MEKIDTRIFGLIEIITAIILAGNGIYKISNNIEINPTSLFISSIGIGILGTLGVLDLLKLMK